MRTYKIHRLFVEKFNIYVINLINKNTLNSYRSLTKNKGYDYEKKIQSNHGEFLTFSIRPIKEHNILYYVDIT